MPLNSYGCRHQQGHHIFDSPVLSLLSRTISSRKPSIIISNNNNNLTFIQRNSTTTNIPNNDIINANDNNTIEILTSASLRKRRYNYDSPIASSQLPLLSTTIISVSCIISNKNNKTLSTSLQRRRYNYETPYLSSTSIIIPITAPSTSNIICESFQ